MRLNDWQNRWRLAMCWVALGLATGGCSLMIAASGVSSVYEIYRAETRADVRARFGEAEETGTCPDGRAMERRWIRQRVGNCRDLAPYSAATFGCEMLGPAYLGSYGLAEVFTFPIMAYWSERAKLHYEFVYGDDNHVLYAYNVTASPRDRFREAVGPLVYRITSQLRESGCPSWGLCIDTFAEEATRRSTCVGHTLTPSDERDLHHLLVIAQDVDANQITKEEGLGEIDRCLWWNFPLHSCGPQNPTPADPAPADRPTQGQAAVETE